MRLSPIIGEARRLPDDNMGHFAIISVSGTTAVGGITTAATGSFLLRSILNLSPSTLMRDIGIRHGDTILTLIIRMMVRSTAITICRQTKSSQMSRPNCITRVITMDRSMGSLAPIRGRQLRITKLTTDSQLRRQLMSRQLSHLAWPNSRQLRVNAKG